MDKLESLELKISKFLRIGVLIAGAFLLVGWLGSFQWNSNPFTNLSEYNQLSLMLKIQLYIMNGEWGMCISYLGLIFLISLPVIRVFLTMFLFIKQKEFRLAIIAGIVLLGLFLSFTFGIEL
jgi:uncharacterized membrane protein